MRQIKTSPWPLVAWNYRFSTFWKSLIRACRKLFRIGVRP